MLVPFHSCLRHCSLPYTPFLPGSVLGRLQAHGEIAARTTSGLCITHPGNNLPGVLPRNASLAVIHHGILPLFLLAVPAPPDTVTIGRSSGPCKNSLTITRESHSKCVGLPPGLFCATAGNLLTSARHLQQRNTASLEVQLLCHRVFSLRYTVFRILLTENRNQGFYVNTVGITTTVRQQAAKSYLHQTNTEDEI